MADSCLNNYIKYQFFCFYQMIYRRADDAQLFLYSAVRALSTCSTGSLMTSSARAS